MEVCTLSFSYKQLLYKQLGWDFLKIKQLLSNWPGWIFKDFKQFSASIPRNLLNVPIWCQFCWKFVHNGHCRLSLPTLVYLIEVTTRGHGIFLIMFVSLFIWYKKICHVYLVCLAPYFDRKWNAAMLIEVVSHFILYKKVCLDY